MGLEFDGMPKKKKEEMEPEEINQDELIGFIMRATQEHDMRFSDVKAVLDAEEAFLVSRGYMDEQ